jgi:tungstate transport system substrate-binding protein
LRRTVRVGMTVFFMVVFLLNSAWAEEKCDGLYGDGQDRFSLATGSPGELGILKALAEAFNSGKSTSMCWRKAGSGESLKLLKDKQVDMVMVHAPAGEKKAIEEGWAVRRTLIGSNEFYIVGPAADPAGIAGAKSAADAYAKIATSKSKFFSRGDNSGTHKKELEVWHKAGIAPSGDWYVITKDFMTATLQRANAEKGYFMTDSSTWVAEKDKVPNLKILFRGDKFLVNTYHALCLPDGASPGAAWAAKFIDFVASKQGQDIIRSYGKDKYGEGLYNDAEYAKKYDE